MFHLSFGMREKAIKSDIIAVKCGGYYLGNVVRRTLSLAEY